MTEQEDLRARLVEEIHGGHACADCGVRRPPRLADDGAPEWGRCPLCSHSRVLYGDIWPLVAVVGADEVKRHDRWVLLRGIREGATRLLYSRLPGTDVTYPQAQAWSHVEPARIRRLLDEARERWDSFKGGPCCWCGTVRSWRVESSHPGHSGATVAFWSQARPGLECAWCERLRTPYRGEEEWRDIVAGRLADGLPVSYRRGDTIRIEQGLGRTVGLRFWHELESSQRVRTEERWQFIDATRIRALGRPQPAPQTGPTYRSGPPCPQCGCSTRWTTASTWDHIARDSASHFNASDRRRTHGDHMPVALSGVGQPVGDYCAGCVGVHDSDGRPDIYAVMEKLVGVARGHRWITPDPRNHPEAPRVDQLGITWFDKAGIKKHPRDAAPFAYLDIPALQVKAATLFPFESEWVSPGRLHAALALRDRLASEEAGR